MKLGTVLSAFAFAPLVAASAAAYAAIPPKAVTLSCQNGVVLHCSISRRANPEFSSDTNCWYVYGGQSYLMRKDYRFNFYNEYFKVHVNDGLRTTASLTEYGSGRRSYCSE